MTILNIFMFFILALGITNVQTNNNEMEVMANSASSAILMEINTGRVLFEKNKNNVYLTASIAKIMTCIVAIENGDLEKYCVVDAETTRQVGSSIYLQLDDEIKLIDLLYGMMLRSGNDAAYLIAVSVSNTLDEFIAQMNNMAKKLNMGSSTFNNPSGLDETTKNYSTAYDMALLMSYAMKNEVFKKITGTATYKCTTKNEHTYVFSNKHKLIRSSKYATGGKTGYTKDAKRTLVTSYEKDNLEVVAVTFNCGDDWNVHERLAEYAFNNYKTITVLKAGIIDIGYLHYPLTPIVYEDVKYVVNNNEKLDCVLKLLKNPTNEKVIGEAWLYVNKEVVKKINIYRYY